MRSSRVFPRLLATALLCAATVLSPVARAEASGRPDFRTAEAGNPFVDGWYADPDVAVHGDTYWVYPTSSRPYAEQTYLDAFSSKDLVHWTKHPNVLTTESVSWAKYAVWAPAPVARNGKYYLYFAANDIQGDDELGGIGVAVADHPAGPYRDALGHPLVGKFHNGAQPIDQDVFVDDDGQAYLYYGGWGHANVVKLNADMTSLGTFPDGSTYREITPAPEYVEGSQLFKRGGKYYLMWSEGGWTGPDYSVSYGMADSPTGPFTRLDKVLAQDPAIARGSGHNSVLNVPGTDIWYIVYHRRPLSTNNGNHRQLAYDRMRFNADGTIARVTMAVEDNFADGDTTGWRTAGGGWQAVGGRLRADRTAEASALLDTNFRDLTQDTEVRLDSGRGEAGLLVRSTAAGGYFAGLTGTGRVVLRRAGGGTWTELASAPLRHATGRSHRVRVTAVGPELRVYVDDLATPKLRVTDPTHLTGANGVRVAGAGALFDDLAVRPAG